MQVSFRLDVCALAGLTFSAVLLSGEVAAQSSYVQGPVTGNTLSLFGVADLYIGFGEGSAAHKTALSSGGNTVSRLGWRGLQDLGGGLAAGFWLEAGLTVDDGGTQAGNFNNQPSGAFDGGLGFNRRATVSLMDFWGELRLGRDFNATYRNREQVDPFSNNGVGVSQAQAGTIAGTTATRVSNSVTYLLPPSLGGFFGEAQIFMGENTQVSGQPRVNDGDGYAARLGWAGGSFAVAVAAGRTQYAHTDATGDVEVVNVGASYDFKVVRITAGYYQDKVNQLVPVKGTGYIVGAIVPIGVHQLKFAYSSYGTDAVDDPRADKLALGYVYNFSKRTAAYASYAYLKNEGGSSFALNGSLTAPNRSSQGFDLGLKHSF